MYRVCYESIVYVQYDLFYGVFAKSNEVKLGAGQF